MICAEPLPAKRLSYWYTYTENITCNHRQIKLTQVNIVFFHSLSLHVHVQLFLNTLAVKLFRVTENQKYFRKPILKKRISI